MTPAVFLDRDGTLIADAGFIADPAKVQILPGAVPTLAGWRDAGYRLIVVTNQSGLARGTITWPQYRAVAERLDALLAESGIRLDATYLCPHLPEISGPCACRKPGLALYQQAAADLDIDLARSLWVGDRVRDVAASRVFGGRGVLVGSATDPDDHGFARVADLPAAANYLA